MASTSALLLPPKRFGSAAARRAVCCNRLGRAWPVLPENNEGDVVGHQQCRNPERRYPVGWAHIRRRSIERCQHYSYDQVYRSLHVENPYEWPTSACISDHSRNRGHSKQGGKQVSECCRIGELRRDPRIDGSRREKHESKVSESMGRSIGSRTACGLSSGSFGKT